MKIGKITFAENFHHKYASDNEPINRENIEKIWRPIADGFYVVNGETKYYENGKEIKIELPDNVL